MAAASTIFFCLPLLGIHSCMQTFRTCPSTFLLTKRKRTGVPLTVVVAASPKENGDSSQKSTKLITFFGKGGSGKTTAAVFAAQHYATVGLRTCLVIHSQDPMADYLLNCKIGNSPVVCQDNLSAVRLETTKMLLEPLKRLKEADAYLNMSQGVLGGIVGEELGVLPGMDSLFLALALEKLARLLRSKTQSSQQQEGYDVVIYDGISTEETLRMIGTPSKARLYLKYMRNLVEKTDLGRLAGPSLMRLVDEAMTISGNSSNSNGRMSADIWDALEQFLERGSSTLSDPSNVGCFLVMDPDDPISIETALRYWGCTIQAGAEVSGVFGVASPHLDAKLVERVKRTFSPLHTAFLPHISTETKVDWSTLIRNNTSDNARHALSLPPGRTNSMTESVKFDSKSKTVTLFMPGFDKSEIKLYQYRGGSELLVEAGDQRRVILLPSNIQGRVGGAKFIDRSLVIRIQ